MNGEYVCIRIINQQHNYPFSVYYSELAGAWQYALHEVCGLNRCLICVAPFNSTTFFPEMMGMMRPGLQSAIESSCSVPLLVLGFVRHKIAPILGWTIKLNCQTWETRDLSNLQSMIKLWNYDPCWGEVRIKDFIRAPKFDIDISLMYRFFENLLLCTKRTPLPLY